jgi:hypothetical protein
MSYRNPQIIVDRSAEIYAQGAAKTGALFAQGVTNYFDYKNKQKEKVDKEKKTYQIGFNKTEGEFDSSLNEVTSKIKIKPLFEIMQNQGANKLNGGIIEKQAQITYNTNLDKETKAEYKKDVADYNFWEGRVVEVSGNVAADLDIVKQTKGSDYGTSGSIEFLGEGNDKFATMIAAHTLNRNQIPGVEVSDATDGDVIGYNITLDPNNDYIKEAIGSGALNIKDLKVTEDGKYQLNWKKNINNWDGSLIVDVPEKADITSYLTTGKVLEDNEISSDFTTDTKYNIDPIGKTGYQQITPKNYFNPNLITDNEAVQGEFLSYAEGQLSQPTQVILSGLRNNYGENVSSEKWNSMTPEEQANFIVDELNEKAIENITNTADIKTDLVDKRTGKVVDPIKIKSLAKEAGISESEYRKDFLDVKYYTLGKSFNRKAPEQEQEGGRKLTPAQRDAIKRTEDRASTVIDLLTESPEQAIATYLGEIPVTRDGSKITITRESGDETWDLTIPSQFENLATELHKKKYGDDDKTLDAIRDILKTKDFDAILKPPFVGPSNKPVLPVKK